MKTIITKKEIIIGDVLDFTYGDGIPTGTIIKNDMVVIPEGTKIKYGKNPHNDMEDIIILQGQTIDVEANTIKEDKKMTPMTLEDTIKYYNKHKKISGQAIIDSQPIYFDYDEKNNEKGGIPMDIESLLVVADKIYINK